MSETYPIDVQSPFAGKRVLLCSMAVPWPQQTLLGRYNLDQARGVHEHGAEMRLFSPAPRMPSWLGRLSKRVRRHIERPAQYSMDGIEIYSPKVWYAYPKFVRYQLGERAPELVLEQTAKRVGPSLMELAREWQPDAIVTHGLMPWAKLAQEARDALGVPVAVIEHSADDVTRLQTGSRLHRVYQSYGQQMDQIYAVGPHMVEHLRSVVGLERCQPLRNGLTFATDEQVQCPRPESFGKGPLIMAAAAYYPRKGFEVLVRAFEAVAAANQDARLHLITNAPPALRQMVESSEYSDRITMVDLLPQRDLVQHLAWADVFALPSWSEAFGIVYLDALGAGTPIIMTEDCGLRSQLSLDRPGAVGPEHQGWAVEPQDPAALAAALSDAIAQRETLQQMGDRARREVAPEFSWYRNAEHVLGDLVGPSPGAERAPVLQGAER